MPLNSKGRKLIKMVCEQHGLKFKGLSHSGILHYSLSDKARVQHFKSTLRKYRLHYRAENTQQSEETGVYTLKIRTEQDHQRLKLQRQKDKLHKKKSPGKGGKSKGFGGGAPAALSLIGTVVESRAVDDKDIRAELGLSVVEWDDLQSANFAQYLKTTIPSILRLGQLVEESQWFFDQLHEHELSTKFDMCKTQIAELLETIADRLSADETLDRLRDELQTVYSSCEEMASHLRNVASQTLNKIVEVSSRPRQAFVEDLNTHWDTLSKVWNDYREVLFPNWKEIAEGMIPQLHEMHTGLSVVKEAAINRLVGIQQLLRKQMYLRDAEELGELISAAKEDSIDSGHVPAITTTSGGWMVYKDDCPAPEYPSKSTLVTDRFAWCKMAGDKRCSAYDGVHGENVICKAAGTHRFAAFFSMISELSDEDLLNQLRVIAKDDAQILSMFKIAESRDEKLYYARISDDRVSIVLDRYPSSRRIGVHSYTIYHVAGEPLMLTNELAICADRSLLQDIDKGTPMPRVATVRTAAVMRITFTSNARMDTNFLDYMRKLNAVKLTENTWDVPFKLEADKARILAELECDFSYPLQVFEIIESPQVLSPRQYEACVMTIVAGAELTKEPIVASTPRPRFKASDRLYDISSQIAGPLAEQMRMLAATLRVASYYVLARADEVYEEEGRIGVNHAEGTRLIASSGRIVEIDQDFLRDVVSGEVVADGPVSLQAFAVESAKDDDSSEVDCIKINLSPAALTSLLGLLGLQAPALIGPPPAVVVPEPPAVELPTEEESKEEEPSSEEESKEEEPSADESTSTEENVTPPPSEDTPPVEDNTPPGAFVTFSPIDVPGDLASGRPKIRFLTPEAQAERGKK